VNNDKTMIMISLGILLFFVFAIILGGYIKGDMHIEKVVESLRK